MGGGGGDQGMHGYSRDAVWSADIPHSFYPFFPFFPVHIEGSWRHPRTTLHDIPPELITKSCMELRIWGGIAHKNIHFITHVNILRHTSSSFSDESHYSFLLACSDIPTVPPLPDHPFWILPRRVGGGGGGGGWNTRDTYVNA